MAAAAVIGAAGSIASSLFGSDSKDLGRRATNARWFNLAQQGDTNAAQALKYMSGRFGAAPRALRLSDGSLFNAGNSGWASDAAKNDAYTKYQTLGALGKLGQLIDAAQSATGLLPEISPDFSPAGNRTVIERYGPMVLTLVAGAILAFVAIKAQRGG